MTDFVKFRRATYAFIDPTRAANDQSGRTVLITGSSEGIGFGIAQAYAQANAQRVILSSSSQHKLDLATDKLRSEGTATEILSFLLDASDASQISSFWHQLQEAGIAVDILVLNAAAVGPTRSDALAETLHFFTFNVTARLHMLEHFREQNVGRARTLLDISSAGLHCYPYLLPAYAASKGAFTTYLCHLADAVPEQDLRVVSLHPGAVFTEAARRAAEFPPDLPFWDHPSLSAHMAVWLATPAAAFLHGRYVWANWDAEELVGMRQRIVDDPGLLKVGITGVGGHTVKQLVEKCKQVPVPDGLD